MATQFTDSFLSEQGIGKLYSEEIVEVATRVNYGSNLDEIHALGALVTMVADDALQIKGGNFQIFEGMIGKSQANVRLNTKIARVRKLAPEYEGADPRFEVITTTGQKEIFDNIVIAAPIVRFYFGIFWYDQVLMAVRKLTSLPLEQMTSNRQTSTLTWICHHCPRSTTVPSTPHLSAVT